MLETTGMITTAGASSDSIKMGFSINLIIQNAAVA